MAMAILPATISIPIRPSRALSISLSSSFLPSPRRFIPFISIDSDQRKARGDMVVRMGGGPRTFPGGVSKWQWKRMQAKKAKQLLKARLLRERQIYETRKRAELKASISQLERPWEPVPKAPNLFSVSADEQVKTLADRFQKVGGFDMWNERDGPQVFRTPHDGLPSVRFFPKDSVHSIKPYTKDDEPRQADGEDLSFDRSNGRRFSGFRKTRSRRNHETIDTDHTQDVRDNVSMNSLKVAGVEQNRGLRNGWNGKRKGQRNLKSVDREGDYANSCTQSVRDNDVASSSKGVFGEERFASFERNDGLRNGWNGRKKGQRDLKSVGTVERNKRYGNNGNRRMNRGGNLLRPGSDLYSEEEGY